MKNETKNTKVEADKLEASNPVESKAVDFLAVKIDPNKKRLTPYEKAIKMLQDNHKAVAEEAQAVERLATELDKFPKSVASRIAKALHNRFKKGSEEEAE